jgi:hypothetical protein
MSTLTKDSKEPTIAIKWTQSDQMRALEEGWYICDSYHLHMTVAKDPEDNIHESDQECLKWIASHAHEHCCSTCTKAIAYLTQMHQGFLNASCSRAGKENSAPPDGSVAVKNPPKPKAKSKGGDDLERIIQWGRGAVTDMEAVFSDYDNLTEDDKDAVCEHMNRTNITDLEDRVNNAPDILKE